MLIDELNLDEPWDMEPLSDYEDKARIIHDFFNEIEKIYKKYNLSIGYEHGNSVINANISENIEWMQRATIYLNTIQNLVDPKLNQK